MSKPIVMESRNPMVPFNIYQNGSHFVFFSKMAALAREGILLFCLAIFLDFCVERCNNVFLDFIQTISIYKKGSHLGFIQNGCHYQYNCT